MSALTFRPATRQAIKPLIGLLGTSGGGKTFSALLLARGIAGPAGRVGIIDTENGRASAFIDMVPGGYDVLDVQPPFSPVRYTEALEAAEAAGIGCLVIDSATHEWAGPGGYLEMKEAALDRMAGNDWKKRDKCALAAAAQSKPAHNRFVDRLIRCSMPVVMCFRGKEKVTMAKDANGKTTIERDGFLTAIQDSGLIFECLLAGEIFAKPDADGVPVGGYFHCTKYTVPSLREVIPGPDEQLGIQHGEAIARWARGDAAPVTPSALQKVKPGKWKAKLWAATKDVHSGDPTALEKYLRGTGIIQATDELAGLTEDQFRVCVEKVEIMLSGN